MAYQKSKHVEAAQKYLHQGKIAQAIAEYLAILKHEPKDQVTLMTVGDLFVRQGETFQALEYFERLAQIYLADGFLTKAVAIYKKITKLAPEEIRPFERLADLYVQQGVMSEARPLYLQMAEMHQRANRPAQAAGLLRKLLDAEPDNPRAQSRLAEILMGLGQSGEAVAALRTAGELLLRRGDYAEALAFTERALHIESADQPTLALKARVLIGSGKQREAEIMLKSLPDAETGGDISKMLVNLYLDAGEIAQASQLAQRIFANDEKNYRVIADVAAVLLERNEAEQALPMLQSICQAALSAGDQERITDLINRAAEVLPGRIEPRELLVQVYKHASDSFRLPDALTHLAEAYEQAGQLEQSVQAYAQLLERDPENEAVKSKSQTIQDRLGIASHAAEPTVELQAAEEQANEQSQILAPPEQELDPETELFVNQAITDVDLYSSYGLTEKALELLEIVLQRVPQHTGALERLLDLCVGLNDEKRTLELATKLEEIYEQAGDKAAADRFGDLRRRFERAAAQNSTVQETPIPSTVVPAAPVTNSTPSPMEFEIPVVESAPVEETSSQETSRAEEIFVEPVVHEVDLSEEWAALTSELQTPDPQLANNGDSTSVRNAEPASTEKHLAEPEPAETTAEDWLAALEGSLGNGEASSLDAGTETTQVQSEDIAGPPLASASAVSIPTPPEAQTAASQAPTPSSQTPSRNNGHGNGPLGNLLEELRADLEDHSNDDDPETHYNLGVAYREMGLLDEAVSEFQQAAKAFDKGTAFEYAMQCFTLLAAAFIEKGQAAIAVHWYERALQLPGLDPETVVALRYDLGISQEMAGDQAAAHKSFLQVYGANIDYRDVAERLASLARAR